MLTRCIQLSKPVAPDYAHWLKICGDMGTVVELQLYTTPVTTPLFTLLFFDRLDCGIDWYELVTLGTADSF